MSSEAGFARARAAIADAERVLVLTGAGISAESGVPTFRGEDGLWRAHRPEELATPAAFRRDPELVWSWYRWRRRLVASCSPNQGHRAIARFALARPGRTTLVTQNVDGLHGRAAREVAGPSGDPAPALPVEIHGALGRDRCSACGHTREAPPEADPPASGRSGDPRSAPLPRCGVCGALLRPDVVWFGEALDPATLDAAFAAAGSAEVCLVVGTSALVHPAASLPLATRGAGGLLVEVNLQPTPLTEAADVHLGGPAAEVLPRIL